jgi:hypothetical protein
LGVGLEVQFPSKASPPKHFEWQLKHDYYLRSKYYDDLFSDMAEIVEKLKPVEERASLLGACF